MHQTYPSILRGIQFIQTVEIRVMNMEFQSQSVIISGLEEMLPFFRGVTIGDNMIAVGNPCKVIREITDEDRASLTKQ